MRIARSRTQRAVSRVPGLGRLAALGAIAGTSLLAGCRQDMHNQPKFDQQRFTTFYADGRSVRPQVENTVARSQLRRDAYFFTGFDNGKEGDGMPFPATKVVLARGQQLYNVYCTPCHSRVGNGAGMIVQRGYAPAGNFHSDRTRQAPLGHFYNVIANGYGAMPDYSSQLNTEERWAVVAYIRALQLSQYAAETDVAQGARVEPLDSISEQEGFAPGFVYDWGLPGTAVKGTPGSKDYVIPPTTSNGPNGGSPGAVKDPVPSRQEGLTAGYGSSEAGSVGTNMPPTGAQTTAGANTATGKQ